MKAKVLLKGDKVAVIAPASAVKKESIKTAKEAIKSLDLDPIFYPSCFMREGHLAGPDKQRAKDINDAFKNKDVKGIFCVRGGYGTPRILDKIDYNYIKENPKIFLGYSDITSLHLAFNTICEMPTLHGPMPSSESPYHKTGDYTLNSLKRNLFTNKPLGRYIAPKGEELETITSGECTGEIIGGNLSLLTVALGTRYQMNTKGKIIFIEEVNELNYIIDRMLTSLDLNNKFKECAGVILGTWKNCRADEGSQDKKDSPLSKIFADIIGKHNIPIVNNFRAGHIYPQFTIPLGTKVHLNAEKKEIIFLESVNQ